MKNEETKEKKTTPKKKTTTAKTQPKKENKKETTQSKKQSVKETTKELPKKEASKKETVKTIKVEKEEKNLKKEEVLPQKIKKNSKYDLLLLLGLVVVIVLGCVLMKGEKEEPSYELPLTLSGDAGLHQLTYQEYQEKIDNNESFVIIIERATCSHCVNFMPIAESFANDHNLPMYYVDTDTFSEEDWTGFEKSNTFLKKNSGSWGTPTTIVLAGNEAVDYIEGETTEDNLLNLYNEYFDMDNE